MRSQSHTQGIASGYGGCESPSHLYVHVPFCARRCSYCDFSIAVRKEVPWREFAAGIDRELSIRSVEVGVGQFVAPLKTLYFGGGTPSHLGGDGVAALMEVVRKHFSIDSAAEVTLEANPEDITLESVARWRDAGINRLSIGIQSFHDNVLKWMHRVHDADAARKAVTVARTGGIANLSLDLIFATPDAVQRSWSADVAEAMSLMPDHISVYGLTIESRTPLGRWIERGELMEASETRYEREFIETHEMLAGSGYEHYEVSNYALPKRRAVHNSVYWHDLPFMGAGPAAHGYDGSSRRWNEPAYAAWLREVNQGRDPAKGSEVLSSKNRIAESVYLGMRTIDGLLIDEREAHHVRQWERAGWVRLAPEYAADRANLYRLVCTPQGWLRLDSMAADLTAFRENP